MWLMTPSRLTKDWQSMDRIRSFLCVGGCTVQVCGLDVSLGSPNHCQASLAVLASSLHSGHLVWRPRAASSDVVTSGGGHRGQRYASLLSVRGRCGSSGRL